MFIASLFELPGMCNRYNLLTPGVHCSPSTAVRKYGQTGTPNYLQQNKMHRVTQSKPTFGPWFEVIQMLEMARFYTLAGCHRF